MTITENGAVIPSLGIEAMFGEILQAVQKSNSEVAELRQLCNELQTSNALLREAITRAQGQQVSSPWTAPPSPLLQPSIGTQSGVSPFLGPTGPAPLYVPPSAPMSASYLLQRTKVLHNFWAVVPAGGAGTRLWPLSREACPKFLLDLTQSGRSLIQETWDRLLPLTSAERLMIVTGSAHAASVQTQLPDLFSNNLFAEPSPKESAAAIGLAAAVLALRDPEAILGSFAADHMISGAEAFSSAVCEAVETARKDYLVTIGIAPSGPATGFGYIRLGEKAHIEGAPNARIVSQFKEKPDAKTAASYLQSGDYRWNGGMFVVKARVLMELLEEHEPRLHEGLVQIASQWDVSEEARKKALDEIWHKLPKIAIDNAVAEPAASLGKVAVVPATFGWDDLGDFASLADVLPKEKNRMCILGDPAYVISEQVAGGIVVPGGNRLVACLGVDDLVIVDTPDALLVTTRARSQELKKLVGKCKENSYWKRVT